MRTIKKEGREKEGPKMRGNNKVKTNVQIRHLKQVGMKESKKEEKETWRSGRKKETAYRYCIGRKERRK